MKFNFDKLDNHYNNYKSAQQDDYYNPIVRSVAQYHFKSILDILHELDENHKMICIKKYPELSTFIYSL